MLQLDAEAAAHGITTQYICATIEDDPLQHRSTARAIETVNCLAAWQAHTRIDERIHLRVELTSSALDTARELASVDRVGLISYMHHTPGYGQFASRQDAWREIYAHGFTGTEHELEDLIADHKRRTGQATQRRATVARIAAQTGTRLVSHDDETTPDVLTAAQLGARINEFPVTADAAKTAHSHGLGVVMGAPNAWHGGSHIGGLAARDVLRAGHLSALASDYHPPSLLASAYALAADHAASWEDALALVTSNPARLAGLEDRGIITPGLRADLVAIEQIRDQPIVRQFG
jgi:alpha-D-ribose 1-methylphosphonate 5-triphosphate diphosphatase